MRLSINFCLIKSLDHNKRKKYFRLQKKTEEKLKNKTIFKEITKSRTVFIILLEYNPWI